MSYVSEVLTDAPLGFLRLGESSGTVAADAGPNNHPGTYVGSPTLGVPGAVDDADTAVSFNGTSQHILSDFATLGPNLGTSTWEFWWNSTSSADGAIAGTINDGFTTFIQIRQNRNNAGVSAGSWWISYRDESARQLNATFSNPGMFDGGWHHVVIQPYGSQNRVDVYVDNVLQTMTYTTSNGGLPGFGSSFTFQYQPTFAAVNNHGVPGVWAPCSLDEIAVYPTRLSAARIQVHYDAASGASGDTAPAKTSDPTIAPTSGVHVGDMLTATSGSYTGSPAPSVSRQWQLNGADVPGATGLTITTADPGNFQYLEVATNIAGSANGASNIVAVTTPEVPPPALDHVPSTAIGTDGLRIPDGVSTWIGV